ncbi:hypothetical protein VTP01DRAFT_6372 [Rhizomucor pusillus]|uniref:uncharacterized protein n=1 Tax=Rhizomucor pusillus TaxID=4840 RepID=UPI00374283E3
MLEKEPGMNDAQAKLSPTVPTLKSETLTLVNAGFSAAIWNANGNVIMEFAILYPHYIYGSDPDCIVLQAHIYRFHCNTRPRCQESFADISIGNWVYLFLDTSSQATCQMRNQHKQSIYDGHRD